MTNQPAIRTAVALLLLPATLRHVRCEPLPADVETLLQIAAGNEDAAVQAAAMLNRPLPVIQQAAAFYIEQVLLSPEADSYRMLGATSEAPTQQLRRNMALLMTWLHPDRNLTGEKSWLAARVTGAWNDVSSDERRRSYDARIAAAAADVPGHGQAIVRTRFGQSRRQSGTSGFISRLRTLIREGRSRPRAP